MTICIHRSDTVVTIMVQLTTDFRDAPLLIGAWTSKAYKLYPSLRKALDRHRLHALAMEVRKCRLYLAIDVLL